MSELAVSQTKVLLGVPEERLHSPSHRVQLDEMARWRVDFVRDDVLHAPFVVFAVARFLLSDQQLHLADTADIALLGPDMVGLVIDRARDCVDALAERTDTDPFTTVAHACIAFDRRNPLLPDSPSKPPNSHCLVENLLSWRSFLKPPQLDTGALNVFSSF